MVAAQQLPKLILLLAMLSAPWQGQWVMMVAEGAKPPARVMDIISQWAAAAARVSHDDTITGLASSSSSSSSGGDGVGCSSSLQASIMDTSCEADLCTKFSNTKFH
eukprot:SAG31_NODE_7057_length_1801_cov_1.783784_1_plen_106_part_00